MNKTMSIIAATLLSLAALAAEADLRPLPVTSYAALPNHAMVRLSPSGRYFSAKVQLDDRYGLVVYDLEKPGQQPYLMSAGETEVRWHQWASDQRLLVSVQRALRRGPIGVGTMETRLVAVDPDGGNGQLLTPRPKRGEGGVQVGDVVVDLLPDDPDHILMSFNAEDPRRPRLYRVNVHNARRSQLAPGRSAIWHWSVDQQLRPRIGSGPADTTTWRISHSAPESRGWETLLEYPVDSGQVFSPVLFDHDDPDLLYVLSNHDSGVTGLYSYRLSSREFVDQLYQHPERDVTAVRTTPDGRRIAGVMFADDEDYVVWFDDRYASLAARIGARLPGRQVAIGSTSQDLSRVIALVSATDMPPRYYLFDAGNDQLTYLAPTYPELEARPLARIRAIEYEARDGLAIPGYLTLPPGTAELPAAPLPAIVLPHGGPHARDYADFDPLLQMLASRGYAVLQMNFRGSTGYGAEFEAAGYREWGQAMQDDVTDGTRWLVERGIADPERICIVGGSYGGYAALMGAAKEPNLYACSVSINGVSDLPRMVSYLYQFVGGRTAAMFITGGTWQEQRQLRENSPVHRAEDIIAPVLLLAGTLDRIVPPDQSRVMARALRRAGKQHELIEMEGGGHNLARADHRLTFFSELDRFLAQHLAPRAAVAADPAP